MTDSNRGLQALCQQCGRWREAVNRETQWTCRECHLEAQGQRLLALVEARGRAIEAARAVARELLDDLASLQADHEIEPRHGERLGYTGFKARWVEKHAWLGETP